MEERVASGITTPGATVIGASTDAHGEEICRRAIGERGVTSRRPGAIGRRTSDVVP